MKKTLFSLAILVANFAFGQITLEHSFPAEENVTVYRNENQTFYCSTKYESNVINIYKADYSLYKTINLQSPDGFGTVSFPDADNFQYISKNIFNIDDKLELLIAFRNGAQSKLQIINEDGEILKNFDNVYYDYDIELFTDKTVNKNKLVLLTTANMSEVYSLPTSELTTKEIERLNKLSAFPIPTNKTLNILNPQNGGNKIEIYDAIGKLVLNKSFGVNENRISINVENLPKGTFVYKIGNVSSKFIKN
jgi:hypothetical protein